MSSSQRSSDNSTVPAPVWRAFTLLEVTIAAAMLAMLIAASVQMLRVVSLHQRATDRQAIALQAIQAIAEQVGNIRWDKLTTETAKQVPIPQPLRDHLPGAKLSIALDEEATPVASRRIHIELTWNGPDGQPVAPVRLTSWVFPERSPSE